MLLVLTLAGPSRLSADDAIDRWIARIADDATRDQARDRLRDAGRKAVPRLILALKHPNATVRSECAFVLGRVGGAGAVVALVATLEDKDATVRRKSAYALGEIADVRAVDALVKTLSDADAGVRANACFALGQIRSPKAARDLVRALADPEHTVRNFAASALGFCREPRALPALAWSARNDGVVGVRALAVSAMGRLKDATACGLLIELLEDDDYLVRARAIEALIVITGKRRGYDPRPRRPRAAAIAAWKRWHRRSIKGHDLLKARSPVEVYDTWLGKPRPKPDPAPKPEPAPVAERAEDVLGIPAVQGPLVRLKRRKTDGAEADAAAFKQASADLDASRLEAAARGFETCVASNAAWKAAHANLAIARHRLKQFDRAAVAYRRCLQLDPRDADVYNNLAAVQEALDKPEEAETFYRLALSVSQDHAPARFNLAELLTGRGRAAAAAPLYETLLKRNPVPEGLDASYIRVRLAGNVVKKLDAACVDASPAALHAAARTFYRAKMFKRTKDLLDRTFAVPGARAESAYLLALFLVRVPEATRRDPDRAAVYAELAMTADATDARYVAAAAEVAWVRGEKSRAVALMTRALKMAPTSTTMRKRLEEYRKAAAGAQPQKDDTDR